MKEADGGRKGLLDGGGSKRRSIGNSKAGRGLLLGFATVACILLFSTRFIFPRLANHAPSRVDPHHSEPHREASVRFDEVIGTSANAQFDEVVEKSDVQDELEKLESEDEPENHDHDVVEFDEAEANRYVEDDIETKEIKLTDPSNLNAAKMDEFAAAEALIADSAPVEEDGDNAEEDADHAGGDAEHAGEDADHAGGDADHAGEDADHAGGDADHAGGDADHAGGDADHAGEDADHAGEDADQVGEDDPDHVEGDGDHDEDGEKGVRKVPDAIAFLARLAMKLTKKTTKDVEDDGNGPYHNRRMYEMEYAEMKRNIKIFVYPYDKQDPYVNIYKPISRTPSGNYASEEFFQQALYKSGFVTQNASEANFFFMPVSITKARLDKRIKPEGLKKFCAKYVKGVREHYGHWNRSNGADHFYLSCHSIARTAMDHVPFVRENAIQLLCPSSYYLPNYITHKDAAVPQIWPRPSVSTSELSNIQKRTRLAFFAGAANSPVRRELVRVWGKDDKIYIHEGRVPYPYSQGLMTSKFCLQAKGFEVNTARLGDSMFYGCVPVVVADYYDLPWQDILDWTKFSIVVTHNDIPLLRRILEEVTDEQYAVLHKNVMKARKHFIWHNPAKEHDAFHTVTHELWKRRHIFRRPVSYD